METAVIFLQDRQRFRSPLILMLVRILCNNSFYGLLVEMKGSIDKAGYETIFVIEVRHVEVDK